MSYTVYDVLVYSVYIYTYCNMINHRRSFLSHHPPRPVPPPPALRPLSTAWKMARASLHEVPEDEGQFEVQAMLQSRIPWGCLGGNLGKFQFFRAWGFHFRESMSWAEGLSVELGLSGASSCCFHDTQVSIKAFKPYALAIGSTSMRFSCSSL